MFFISSIRKNDLIIHLMEKLDHYNLIISSILQSKLWTRWKLFFAPVS